MGILGTCELSPVPVPLGAGCDAWHLREVGKWCSWHRTMLSRAVWAQEAVLAACNPADPALWFPSSTAFL